MMTGKSNRKKSRALRGVGILLRITGVLILAAVIAACVPLTVPKFMGYRIFHVTSGSMEPAIPTGSIIYVEGADPVDVQEQQVIAYQMDGSFIVHRVLKNHVVEGEFLTKGDANDEADFRPVKYDRLIGVVTYHIPWLGKILGLFESTTGKLAFLIAAIAGILLNVIGGNMKTGGEIRE